MNMLSAAASDHSTMTTDTGTQYVAHYLVTAVPVARSDDTVGQFRDGLVGAKFEDASHVFVLDNGGRLLGVIAIGEALSTAEGTLLADLAQDTRACVVTPSTDREEAASLAIRSSASVLAVCDADARFIGAVPASAIISILRDEHLEDLHHMVGILGKSEAAKAALTSPPYRRAFFRLPWLLVGMAGSALATAMMVHFEDELAAHITVAFFIPAIVYLTDAVGTQSEAVAVRGISLNGAGLPALLVGEIGTGAVIGGALGLAAFPLVWLFFGNIALATTVAITLVVASTVATTIGLALPWVFARLGCDPALGSGPIATVIQDVLSLLLYFVIATALLD